MHKDVPESNDARCPHHFAEGKSAPPHYCTYIQVPLLLQSFPKFLRTVDDHFLYSCLSSSVLWMNLLKNDLQSLNQSFIKLSSYPDGRREDIKRLRRANSVLEIVLIQSNIARDIFIRRRPKLSFVLTNASRQRLPLFCQVNGMVADVQANLLSMRGSENAVPVQSQELEGLTAALSEKLAVFGRVIDDLFSAIRALDSPRQIDLVDEFLRPDDLLRLSLLTLARHHPQALLSTSTTDELMFVNAHQAFELWFPSMLFTVDCAVDALLEQGPKLLHAELLIRRVAKMLSLFEEMIKIPATMTAADYMAFRRQLMAGSGAESIGFRLMEISLGQRDKRLLGYLDQMGLLTTEIQRRLERPSLNDAFLHVLANRMIASDKHQSLLKNIVSIMLPTNAENPHADLMWLSEALLDVEQNLDTWRTTHLALVDRMIGYRQSLGVGGKPPVEMEMTCPYAGTQAASDSRPYLESTLLYGRMFPLLWEARGHLGK